jgi:hypothetical protein
MAGAEHGLEPAPDYFQWILSKLGAPSPNLTKQLNGKCLTETNGR